MVRESITQRSMFSWKDKTFTEVSTFLRRNTFHINVLSTLRSLQRALPTKHYRKEIVSSDCNKTSDFILHKVIHTDTTCESRCQEDNAKRRVRSSGRFTNQYDSNTKKKIYFTNTKEYLQSRSKSNQQNEFHYTSNNGNEFVNEFRANSQSYCGRSIPVFYKPSNHKFACQGAVDSGTRLLRLKTDTSKNVF